MALYAKKISYAASDESGEFVALIMLSNKKGGSPSGFILYSYNRNSKRPRMIECPSSEEEAKKLFPYGTKDGFFSDKKAPWKITTFWLYEVSVGGGYRVCSNETWVKVGRPRPVRKKLKRPKFGELSHIYRALRDKISSLELEKMFLLNEISFCDHEEDKLSETEKVKFSRLTVEIEKIKEEIELLEIEKSGIRKEMEFVRDRHFATA